MATTSTLIMNDVFFYFEEEVRLHHVTYNGNNNRGCYLGQCGVKVKVLYKNLYKERVQRNTEYVYGYKPIQLHTSP